MSYVTLGSENVQLLKELDQLVEKHLDKKLDGHLKKILQAIQNMTVELPEGIQVSEVCRTLNIDYNLFKRLKKEHKLDTFKVGGKVFVEIDSLRSSFPSMF